MKKSRKPEQFVKSPAYPGGAKAMENFVREQLRYPEEALRMKISGAVSIIADIDYKGNVIKTSVKKGLGFGCDEEAARVVALMKFEGHRYRGLHVVFHKTINLHFQLPGVKPVDPSVSYTYTETNKITETVYTYKITTG